MPETIFEHIAKAQASLRKRLDAPALFQAGVFLLCLAFNIERVNAAELFCIPIEAISSVLKGLCALAFSICALSHIRSRNEVLLALGVFVFLVFGYLSSRSLTFIWCALAVLAARESTLQWIARSVFISYAGLFVAVCALCLAGIVEPVVGSSVEGAFDRSSLGFSHPNQFGIMLVGIAMSWLVWRMPRITKIDFLVPVACIVLCMAVAGSRTSIAILILFSGSLFVYLGLNQRLGVARLGQVAIIALLSFFLLSVLVMIVYDDNNPILFSLSKLTSGRLYYMSHYAHLYPITPFGQDFSTAELLVKETFSTRLLLDNAYACVLLKHGYVLTLSFGAVLVAALNSARRVSNPMAAVFFLGMLSFVVLGFFENGMIDVTVNFFLLGLTISAFPESKNVFFSSDAHLLSGFSRCMTNRKRDS